MGSLKLLGVFISVLTIVVFAPRTVHAKSGKPEEKAKIEAVEEANEESEEIDSDDTSESDEGPSSEKAVTEPVTSEDRINKLEAKLEAIEKSLEKKEPSVSEKAAPISAFDDVPRDQRGSVASRLKLIENLILKYGRAYDYRKHSAKELREIVRSLERETTDPR